MAIVVEATSVLTLSGTNPSASVTVDADADAVYILVAGWYGQTGQAYAAPTLGGNDPDESYAHNKSGDSFANDMIVCAWYSGGNLPASGSRTFFISASPASDGPVCVVAQLSGVDSAGWRDADSDSYGDNRGQTENMSVTLTTVSGDEVFKLDYKYNATSSIPSLTSGWANTNTQFNNGGNCRLSRETASTTTQVCDTENENYSSVIAITVIPAASGALTASGTPLLDALTATGVVDQIYKPSGSPTLDALTASGVASFRHQATGAAQLEALLANGVIQRRLQASGSPELDPITATGVASKTALKTASGSPSIAELIAVGGVIRILNAAGTAVLEELTATGVAELPSGVIITDVNTTESWIDGDSGLVITGSGFL